MIEPLGLEAQDAFVSGLNWDPVLDIPTWKPSYSAGTLPEEALLTSPFKGRSFVVERERERLEIWIADSAPDWLQTATERIATLLLLEPDWDSYGGLPVNFRAAATALELMQFLVNESILPPSIVPTASGGIQLEWHASGIDLEIELMDRRNTVFFCDLETGMEWEDNLAHRLSDVVEIMGRLASDQVK